MNHRLTPHNAEFLAAFSDEIQLKDWLLQNQNIIGFCFLGRSNVGKSSLINTIFGKHTARTSKTPGRTREILLFRFTINMDNDQNNPSTFYFFDLPGYGHANISKEMAKNWERLLLTFFEFLSPHITHLIIQDARHPNQPADQEFYSFIAPYGYESFLIFNKIDKLKTQKEKAQLEKQKKGLSKFYKSLKQMYFVSAEKFNGIDELNLGLKTYLYKKLMAQNNKPE